MSDSSMEHLMGLLRVHVIKGVDLAIRDLWSRSSDPYIVVRMGKQKVKTGVVRNNVNPEWNQGLTLTVSDPNLPIKLSVYDKDTFTLDDKMGDAEFTIYHFLEAQRMHLANLPDGTIIKKVLPSRENCLSEESCIVWNDGKIVQNMFLKLRNVECGEVQIRLEWITISGSRGI